MTAPIPPPDPAPSLPDDDDIIPANKRFGMMIEVREVRKGMPLADPDDQLSYPYDPTTRLLLSALAELAEAVSAIADEVGLPTRQGDMETLAGRLRAALGGEDKGGTMHANEVTIQHQEATIKLAVHVWDVIVAVLRQKDEFGHISAAADAIEYQLAHQSTPTDAGPDHDYRFVRSHGNGTDTIDEYTYCARCGTMRHTLLVSADSEIKERDYTTMAGKVNTVIEPGCTPKES